MLKVSPVRAFTDNYIWTIHGIGDPSRVAVVDPGDASPVFQALETNGWVLGAILATHHHADHVGGVSALKQSFDVPVYGPSREHTPCLTESLTQDDEFTIESLGLTFRIFDIPGHTAGHIAYYGHDSLFCGDTLFSAGCGRLFEGTPRQMSNSLAKLAALPDDTMVFCGHEYTVDNLRFAEIVEPDNMAISDYIARARGLREDGEPTLPSTLGLEKAVNPFLRCHVESVRHAAASHAGADLADVVTTFAQIRRWKDGFA